jgi:magnesium-transporting ATPase (P-type)
VANFAPTSQGRNSLQKAHVMTTSTFTLVHTVLSIVALVAGIIVVMGLLASKSSNGWTAVYLVTAVATSATGFGFASPSFMPSHWVGVISLVVLLAAILARYVFHFAGSWRLIYAVSMVLSVYFLVFVAIAQAFLKVPALRAMAPTQSEPPFAIAQGVCLVIFIALAIAAARKFHPVAAT